MWQLLLVAGALFLLSRRSADATGRGGGKTPRLLLPNALPPLRVTPRISSRFGPRVDPVYGDARMHEGIDLSVPIGTSVFSPVDGVVTRVDTDGVGRGEVNGNAVLMRGAGLSWAFLHLSLVGVAAGQAVVRGQFLGLTGDTGKATGPHLHLMVADASGPLDPEKVFRVS